MVDFRNGHQEKETNQYRNDEHHIEVQHHIETQHHHVADENDGHNHTHPKLDIKNFHTQLW